MVEFPGITIREKEAMMLFSKLVDPASSHMLV